LKEGKRKGACDGAEPLLMSCSAGHRRRSQQEEEERNSWPCVADSLPWRGGERPPSATATPRAEKNGMATRVLGQPADSPVLIWPKMPDSRRMQIDGQECPAAAVRAKEH
jgi:hypothetical protein